MTATFMAAERRRPAGEQTLDWFGVVLTSGWIPQVVLVVT